LRSVWRGGVLAGGVLVLLMELDRLGRAPWDPFIVSRNGT
jgi:hypothetical protein